LLCLVELSGASASVTIPAGSVVLESLGGPISVRAETITLGPWSGAILRLPETAVRPS
jgi:hypothetical protein